MAGLPALSKNRGGQTNTGDEADLVISIRRKAATGIEQSPVSDGNVESNEEATAPAAAKPTKPAKAAKVADKGNASAAERTPPFAKDPVSGDGWQRARAAARKMHRGK